MPFANSIFHNPPNPENRVAFEHKSRARGIRISTDLGMFGHTSLFKKRPDHPASDHNP